MSTLVMQYQEQRMIEPIDKPTFIFALATFGGVSLYGLTVCGMIITDIFSKLM